MPEKQDGCHDKPVRPQAGAGRGTLVSDADPSKREGRRIETRDPTVPGTLETDIKVQAIQEGHEERCDRNAKG